MKLEGSSPRLQKPATCPYPKPDQPSPCRPHPTSRRSILIVSSHRSLDLPSCLFRSGFPTRTLYVRLLCLILATCPVQLILLDLITRMILGEEYRSLSSSFRSFLHSPVSSSLLGPNDIKGEELALHKMHIGLSVSRVTNSLGLFRPPLCSSTNVSVKRSRRAYTVTVSTLRITGVLLPHL